MKVETLWCPNQRRGRSNGWSFPPKVGRLLAEMTAGQRVLHLFGGRARFGMRIDIDPLVRPDVIADAWLPPFARGAFDVVVLDPPYTGINQQMKNQLLRAAAYVALERVVWFHTLWIASDASLPLERAWLVRVGDQCQVRCIQVFKVLDVERPIPRMYFDRGPAIRYNRWLAGELRLPFDSNYPTQ